jgi:hypothetical protein
VQIEWTPVCLGRSLSGAMLVLAAPAIGFALGLLLARWSIVLGATVLLIVLSAVGLPLGWLDAEDMQPLGGLIITAIYFEIPFLAFPALRGGAANVAEVRRILSAPAVAPPDRRAIAAGRTRSMRANCRGCGIGRILR